jgi:hypothetical protein
MNQKIKLLIINLIFLLLLGQQTFHSQAILIETSQSEAVILSSYAENKILEAYQKIFLAENRGFDTTYLLTLMDKSIQLYDVGINQIDNDPNGAIINLNQSITQSNIIINYNLNNDIFQKINLENRSIIINLSTSVIIVILCLISWIIFENYYTKTELSKKIEVK